MEAQKGRQLAQRPHMKLDPGDSSFPFPKGEQSGNTHPSCGFQMSSCRPLSALAPSLSPEDCSMGPPTSQLDTTSYLAFGTSPGDEKDVARLRPEGSSLGKESSQKSGSQALNSHPPYGLPTRD